MSIRQCFVLAGLAACSSQALAQFTSVLQERSVTTSVSVTSGGSDNDSDQANNFGPFIGSVSSSIAGPGGAQADAGASQNSQMSATSITGLMNAQVAVRTGTTFVVGEGDSDSTYLYIFNVTSATEVVFSANGELGYIGRNPDGEPSDLYGSASVRLINAITEEPIAGFTLFSEPGGNTASFEGELPAGQYAILAHTRMHGYSADLIGPPLRSGSGTTTVTFNLAVASSCSADFNGDGTADFFDYLDFVDAFSAGC